MDEQMLSQPSLIYERIFRDGNLIYEGYTLGGKAYGEGTSYWDNGQIYQKGIFSIKGLVEGEQYYASGNLRFRGKYQINRAYGPNYPVSGDYYDEDGHLVYSGDFQVTYGGVGYPIIQRPEQFGAINICRVPIPVFMWEDARKYEQYDIGACAPGEERK